MCEVSKQGGTHPPSGSCMVQCLTMAEGGRGFVPEHLLRVSSTRDTSFRASYREREGGGITVNTHTHTHTEGERKCTHTRPRANSANSARVCEILVSG